MHTQITSVFTDRRHYLERELDEMMQNNPIWQSLREGSLDGIWYRDLERPNNEWVSPEFWRLLGFDPAEKKHAPDAWMDLIFREDLSKATANFRAHCENPTHPYDQILRYRHANGSTIWVRCRGVAIRNTDGKPVRMLGTHSDVTTLKRAEEAAIAENGITSDANEELKAFAYSTSHDLKSPANTIRMLLEEARRALNTGDVTDAKHMLAKAETTNDAMRSMVDNLLEYTRMVGKAATPSVIDLDDLLVEVVEILAAEVKDSGAEITIDTLGIVNGTAWQLRRMFQNLISNAIKFQIPGNTPKIEVRSVPSEPGFLMLEIEDNGIGIKEADQTRIFDLFSKLHPSSVYPGTGVGLAFCARVVQAHGGMLSVTSSPGHGTTVSIQLPLRRGH